MLCLNVESTDPFFNLAAEECLLKDISGEYLILYINSPAVIIGKHQVAHREADTAFVSKENIPVIRRISGGGAVFHDAGNLNFSFILQSSQGRQVDFKKYTEPVIDFLRTLGITASFEGKNDLKVGGFKISGNAEHVFHERVLHHGTLLFNSDLRLLSSSLRKDTSHYSTRAVGSNPSPVMNLKQDCPHVNDTNKLKMGMLLYFLAKQGNSPFEMPPELREKCSLLADSKFRTWEWNYAYGPEYHFNNNFILNGNSHSCRLYVKDGIIWECEIQGSGMMTFAGKKLIGCRHMVRDMTEVLKKEDISLSPEEVLGFF
jgi:lipoate-protein ligase A